METVSRPHRWHRGLPDTSPRQHNLGVPARSILVASVIMAVCATRPQPEPSAPVVAATGPVGGPHEVEHTYQGGKDDAGAQPARDESDHDQAPEAGDDQAVAPALPDPAELEERVREAVVLASPSHDALLVSPPLPIGWPAAPGKVLYLVYPLAPLESGVSSWQVGRLLAKVTVTLEPEEITVEVLEPGKKAKPLGSFVRARPRGNDPVRDAEAALFELVSGKREADKARYLFARYSDWLELHAPVNTDIRAHAGVFFAWTGR